MKQAKILKVKANAKTEIINDEYPDSLFDYKPLEDKDIWDELAVAYTEGVNSI